MLVCNAQSDKQSMHSVHNSGYDQVLKAVFVGKKVYFTRLPVRTNVNNLFCFSPLHDCFADTLGATLSVRFSILISHACNIYCMY